MENLSYFDVFIICFCAGFLYNHWQSTQRKKSVKEDITKNPEKQVMCAVEYDSQDPNHKIVYVYNQQNQTFLTQAETIRAAISNLVDQGYTQITFHPEHCPKEIFDSMRFYKSKEVNIKS